MAGITLGAGRGARRALDSELHMVPMIDLLMVTISFLLITAVWSNLARLQADARVPGGTEPVPAKTEARLHVELGDPGKITLHWNAGATVVRSAEIPRHEVATVERGARGAAFPELRAKLEEEWRAMGSHTSATDPASDELVLHTSDSASYAEIVGAMDAAFGVKRACAGGRVCPAFRVVFAAD
jgi:biopolymer transport protein ExbD